MSRRKCCCFITCVVFNDDFDNLVGACCDSNWTEESPDWEYTNPGLRENGNAGALVLTTKATKTREQAVSVNFTGVGNGDALRVVANAVDADNYWFVELRQSSGGTILEIFKRELGSNGLALASITMVRMTDTDIPINLCVSDEEFTASITHQDNAEPIQVFVCNPELYTNGKLSGIGNGAATTIDITVFQVQQFVGDDGVDVEGRKCCIHKCQCVKNGIGYCVSKNLILTLTATGDLSPLNGVTVPLIYDEFELAWIADSIDQPACLINTRWVMLCGPFEGTDCFDLRESENQFALQLRLGDDLNTCNFDLCVRTVDTWTTEASTSCVPLVLRFKVMVYEWPGLPADDIEPCLCGDPRGVGTWFGTVTEAL